MLPIILMPIILKIKQQILAYITFVNDSRFLSHFKSDKKIRSLNVSVLQGQYILLLSDFNVNIPFKLNRLRMNTNKIRIILRNNDLTD